MVLNSRNASLFNSRDRSGWTPGGADLPGVQQGWLSGPDGFCGRLCQADQHHHRQGGCLRDAELQENKEKNIVVTSCCCNLCRWSGFSVGREAKQKGQKMRTNPTRSSRWDSATCELENRKLKIPGEFIL